MAHNSQDGLVKEASIFRKTKGMATGIAKFLKKLIPNNLKMKLIVVFIMMSFFQLLIVYFSSTYIIKRNLIEKSIIVDENSVSNKAKDIKYQLNQIILLSNDIVIDKRIQNSLTGNITKNSYGYFQNIRELLHELSKYTDRREYITDILIIDNNKNLLAKVGYYNEKDLSWYYNYVNAPEYKPGFSYLHSINQLNREDIQGISYISDIYSISQSNVELGKIIINIDVSKLVEDILGSTDLRLANPIVYSSSSSIIYQANDVHDTSMLTEYMKNMLHEEQNYYVLTNNVIDDIYLSTLFDKNLYNKSIFTVTIISMFILIVLLIVTSSIIIVLTNYIFKPIGKLVSTMDNITKGDLETVLEIESYDEFNKVSQAFNFMIKSIKELMSEAIRKEKIEKELTIEKFILQMNPHFLYNTLNSIIYLSVLKKNDEITNLTKNLIHFLKEQINTDALTMTTVRNEIQFIKSYFLILKYRYDNAFEIVYDIDQMAEEELVPKLMLYPFVENAIYHGILPEMQEKKLHISIKSSDAKILISIHDDGAGIPDEILQNINSNKSFYNGKKHIGITNIIRRFMLIYNEDYYFNIFRQDPAGTKVIIIIPKGNRENDNHQED